MSDIAGMALEGEIHHAYSLLNPNDIEAAARPADLDAAKEFRNKTCIREKIGEEYRPYSVCGTPLHKLGDYGVGIELYFKLVKSLFVLFFIISCVSIGPIYINNSGNGLTAGDIREKWDPWSIANTDSVNFASDKDWNRETLRNLFVCDAVYTGIFIVFIIFFQLKSARTITKNAETSTTLADYAVESRGFPENCKEGDVKEHFEKFGTVHEVFLARRYGGLLDAYRKRAAITYELGYLKLLQKRGNNESKNIEKVQAKLKKLDQKIEESEQNSSKTHAELPVIKAFVVFKSTVDRKNCIINYKKDKGCCKRLKNQRIYLKFQETYPLKVHKTGAPSNILYENIEISSCSRFIRRVISLFCVLIALIISIIMIYSLKIYQDDLPSSAQCASIDASLTVAEAESAYKSNTDKYCYCKDHSLSEILNDSSMESFCSYFFERISINILLRVSVSIGVIFINFIIKIIFRMLGRFERVSNKSIEQLKLMSKVFVATFINTALIILVVNANFSSLDTQYWLPKFVFNSDYSDFSRLWYVNVGSTIVSTMMISIFSPHCVILLTFYPLGLCKRHCCTKRYISQSQANMKFSGADFDLATRNSLVLNVVFTCFLYSGGMPIMNVICCLTMFMLYWVDKFLILRHYKKPPLYDGQINQRALSYLPFAVIFHCAFSLYMYGATDLFPYHIDSNGPYGRNSIGERIASVQGYVNIILAGVALSIYLWVFLFSKGFEYKMKNKVIDLEDRHNAEGTIGKDLKMIAAHGLKRYDISKHPEYKDLIKIMNAAAGKVKNGGIDDGKNA